MEGLNLTRKRSYATVALTKNPNGFLVEFPNNPKIFYELKKLRGVRTGDTSPYPITKSIYVPRYHFKALKTILGKKVDWRSNEELQEDIEFLNMKQERLQDVLSRISHDIDTSYMKIDPYSFQKLAVAWAAEDKGLSPPFIKGGLLADQMGLGKTIEAMAIAGYFHKKGWIKNVLFITPATIKNQVQQEIIKFTNFDSILIKSKNKGFDDRKNLYERIQKETPFFTIINYELLYQKEVVDKLVIGVDKKTGKEKTKKIFGDYLDLNEIKKIGYDMVIVDEAHKMKNPNTQIAETVRQIDAKYKLLMTGTPIQKELKNLFQLFDYIDPSILSDPSLTFEERKQFFEDKFLIERIDPFVKNVGNTKLLKDESLQVIGEINEVKLRERINPFLLRRLSEDISDEMPKEIIQDVVTEFNDEQIRLLNKVEELTKEFEELANAEKVTDKKILLENQIKGLNQTKMVICDAPSLLLNSKSNLIRQVVGKKKRFKRTTKLERLIDIVEEAVENNKKVVIFTKFARMADLIQEEVSDLFKKNKSFDEFQSYVYKGQTPQDCKLKDELVKQSKTVGNLICSTKDCPFFEKCSSRTKIAYLFQHDKEATGVDCRVIVATDAANYGINLQKSNILINVDLPDSFSTYLQRNGRIKRLGSQHSSVFIYNMITSGGKDEQVYKQIKKQIALNDKIIENNDIDNKAIQDVNSKIDEIKN